MKRILLKVLVFLIFSGLTSSLHGIDINSNSTRDSFRTAKNRFVFKNSRKQRKRRTRRVKIEISSVITKEIVMKEDHSSIYEEIIPVIDGNPENQLISHIKESTEIVRLITELKTEPEIAVPVVLEEKPVEKPKPPRILSKHLIKRKKLKTEYLKTKNPWNVRNHWTTLEFNKYSKWIENIYHFKKKGTTKQKQSKLDEILCDPEMNLFLQKGFDDNQNPLLSGRNLMMMNNITHCGSFPKILHIYYSYKRGLPLTVSFVTGEGNDIRYSKNNKPIHTIDNLSFKGNIRKFLLRSIVSSKRNHFTTGNFRTSPELENTDSVPIRISRNFLKAGVLAYNAGGHALLAGRVTDDGEVYFMDAHPDNSISFSKNISVVSRVSTIDNLSKCYGGFKILRLAKTEKDDSGRVIGVVPMTNDEMKEYGYSLEQYEMMKKIRNKTAMINNKKISNFHDYLRKNIKTNNFKDNPHTFVSKSAKRLHEMFKTRQKFVEDSWEDVIANGSVTLPDNSVNENIYQANGRWETWSSPSSDIDRKCAVIYVGERLESMINSYSEDSSSIELAPELEITNEKELAENLLNFYRSEFSKYSIEFTTSKHKTKEINLYEICNRLWDMSFDPNHPPEIRWGEPISKIKNYVKINTTFKSGPVFTPEKSYNVEKCLRFYMERQDKPTTLGSENNPSSPLAMTPEEKLGSFITKHATSMK